MIEHYDIETSYGIISSVFEKPEIPDVRGTAIVMHGRRSSKERPSYKGISEIALNNGFQVIRFDFRGHGHSHDTPNWDNYGFLDHVEDLNNVVKYYKEKGLISGKVILISTSFSADVSLIYACKYGEGNAVILVSPGLGKNSSGTKDNEYRATWWDNNSKTTQIPFVEYKSLLEKLEIPVYSLHGTKDASVPVEQSMELKKIIGDNFTLFEIADGEHNYLLPDTALLKRQQILDRIFKDFNLR